MNRKLKTISAALLAATICASLAGCANNEKPNSENSKYTELNESNIESYIESVFGGGNSSAPETSEPEEYKPEVTDEIKNAALNSGLIQLNNDIFQRGGYMTAADLVEKYKDYLLEYCDTIFERYDNLGLRWKERKMGSYAGNQYSLKLTPKNGTGGLPVEAYVVNATSPDEKITLDKAIVAEVSSNYSDLQFITPEWFPMGFNYTIFKKYESENKNFTVKTMCEALEAEGIKERSDEKDYLNTYSKSEKGDYIVCYVLGEENLFGAKPLYYYCFIIDINTDKLESVSCTLEYFVKE